MKSTHEENCIAPICAGDSNTSYKTQVLWFPGESVCTLKSEKFQKVQRRINKRVANGTFKNMDRSFTAAQLARLGRVTDSTKGVNPEKSTI